MYRRSEEHSNADGLLRLPCQESRVLWRVRCILLALFMRTSQLWLWTSQATIKDPLLCKVYQYTLNGWPDRCDDKDMKPFHNRRYELSWNVCPLGNSGDCTGSPESSVAERVAL